MQYVLFTHLENFDCDSEIEDIQMSTVSSWNVKSVESTQHILKKIFEITNTVLIYPQKLFQFNFCVGMTTQKRLHSSSDYGHVKLLCY